MTSLNYKRIGIILSGILFVLFQLTYWIQNPGFIDTLFSWMVGIMIIFIIIVVILLITKGDRDVYMTSTIICMGTLFLIMMQVVLFQNPHTRYGVCIHDGTAHPMVTLDYRTNTFIYQTGGVGGGNEKYQGKLYIKNDTITFRYYEDHPADLPDKFILTEKALFDISEIPPITESSLPRLDPMHHHVFEFR